MTLPEVDLGTLTVQDHEDHHNTIHDILNRLLIDTSSVGEVLCKTSGGTGTGTIGTAQPHYTFPAQVRSYTHSAAGALSIAAERQTKAIKVSASANITSLAVGGLEFIGQGFSQVWVQITATAPITLNLTGAANLKVIGTPVTSLASGESVEFIVQRWDT